MKHPQPLVQLRERLSLCMMRNMSNSPADASPSQPYVIVREMGDEPAPSSWPTIIGVLGIAYAAVGCCMQTAGVAYANFNAQIMKLQGVDVQLPREMTLAMNVQGGILIPLGVLLAIGSIFILRRRTIGPKLVLLWAAARLIMAVVGFAWGIMTIDVQVKFTHDTMNALANSSNPAIAKAMEPQLASYDPVTLRREGVRNLALTTAAFTIVPCVMGFMLTSKKRKAEITAWGQSAV